MTESLPDLEALLPSWHLYMRSARLSPRTIVTYTSGVKSFLDFCERTGSPPQLTKVGAQGWVVDLLDGGAQPATATTWLGALKRYATWLEEEGEIPANPLIGMRTPRVDRKVTNALTDEQIKALLHTCKGKTLRNRRDEAILRLLIETGIRASELVDLQTADVDLTRGLVTVHRGKGGKGRFAPFGAQTAAAIDRYLRLRHQYAETGNTQLFIGANIKTFSYWALAATLRRRAREAGVPDFHVHLTRHTAATRWLRAGGSEGGLMAVAGWSNRQMIDRYTGATAAERAVDEARNLALGDL
ncbi:tyrosine-type recombinase/integrase [Mycobacterium sp.]|uniref:tyrosine-type recombinase/integrase n=1 Tax=Mycobacterium sp. TaxID=1785 RepID=UPI003F9C9325